MRSSKMLGDSWQKLVKVGSGLMWHVLFKFNSESIGGGGRGDPTDNMVYEYEQRQINCN